ncbi:hypothetical protein [Kineococcus sp. G2]|uniref:hypothetical protein n=1 Tax=Kineococcus sp. G2 TaxID=3127484 RepID=UPI00301BE98E
MSTANAELNLPRTRVFSGEDADRELASRDLRAGLFLSALQEGNDRRAACTAMHPKTYPGQKMWAETLAALRALCIGESRGWEIGSTGNYETVFSPKQRIAIAVVGSDPFTGVKGFRDPCVTRARGPKTTKRVIQNRQGQLLFDLPSIADTEDITDENCDTWFFLSNAREGKLYSELSLPVGGETARINQWAMRILFTPLTLDHAVTPVAPDFQESEVPEIKVGRRGNSD